LKSRLLPALVAALNAPGARWDWLAWLATRGFVLGIVAGLIPWAEQVNDLNIYSAWVREDLISGRFPSGDPMWQYPPLAAPVFIAGELAPGGRLGYALAFALFDAATMMMLSAQASRTALGGGRRLWALAPLAVGPLILARFDVVPTATAVAAVMLAGRPMASGAWAAVGAWLKVWPALAILGLPRRDLPRGIAGALAATVIIAATLLLLTTDAMAFLAEQAARGLQVEAVAALPFHLVRLAGGQVNVVYQFGAHEFVAPGARTLATWATITGVVLMGLVVLARLAGRLEAVIAADVVLATVLFSVVTSRVFSGQYFIWLLGLGAVALGDPRTRMRAVVALIAVSGLASHLVYPWLYSALLDGRPVAILVQVIRVSAIVAASAVAAWQLARAPSTR
jgi:hypothetical protein